MPTIQRNHSRAVQGFAETCGISDIAAASLRSVARQFRKCVQKRDQQNLLPDIEGVAARDTERHAEDLERLAILYGLRVVWAGEHPVVFRGDRPIEIPV